MFQFLWNILQEYILLPNLFIFNYFFSYLSKKSWNIEHGPELNNLFRVQDNGSNLFYWVSLSQ